MMNLSNVILFDCWMSFKKLFRLFVRFFQGRSQRFQNSIFEIGRIYLESFELSALALPDATRLQTAETAP